MTAIAVVVIGVALLGSLSTLIGITDGRARRQAWARIAQERRELGEWERELIAAAESRGCASCKLLRARFTTDDPYGSEDESGRR